MILVAFVLLMTASQPMKIGNGDLLRKLISKTAALRLPFTYDLKKGPSKGLYEINARSSDTLFFEGGIIGGFLPDTTNYFAILHYQVGDLLYPFLSTFDKQGKLIDQKKIGIGACGGHVIDIKSCIDNVTINQTLKIDSFYKVVGTAEDNSGNEVKVCNTITGSGRLKPDGKIEYSEGTIVDCN